MLRQAGDPATLQPLDQPKLPQRLVPVELLGEHARGLAAEQIFAPRRGQTRVADVVAGYFVPSVMIVAIAIRPQGLMGKPWG